MKCLTMDMFYVKLDMKSSCKINPNLYYFELFFFILAMNKTNDKINQATNPTLNPTSQVFS